MHTDNLPSAQMEVVTWFGASFSWPARGKMLETLAE